MFAYFIRTAFVQLMRYRAQSSLAILGVAIGVANIIVLISITDLGKHQSTSFMKNMGANMLFVAPYFDMQHGGFSNLTPAQASQFLPRSTLDNLQDLPEIEAICGVVMLPGHLGYGEKRWFTTLEGVSPEYLQLRNDKLSLGQWFSVADNTNAAPVVVLGAEVCQQLFGDAPAVGREVIAKGRSLKVIGVMAAQGKIGLENIDNRAFLPLNTAQDMFGYDGLQGIFMRYRRGVDDLQAVELVKAQLQPLLKPGETIDDTFTVWTVQDATKMLNSTLGIFRTVLLGIASIAMLVAGIGIFNVMLMRVINRRLEIGIRRAVGAPISAIGWQFLVESLIQSVIGGVFGFGLGIAGVYAYCAYSKWQPYLSASTIAIALAYSLAAGVLFGAYPAWRAARQDPIRCLHNI